MKHQIAAVQRRTALSEWLASTVAPTIVNALRAEAPSSSAQKIFTRLTGYQVEKAVDEASAEGNIRLALLLSQAGGDAQFRADLEDQLTVWATEGADQFVSEAYRKCIALLAGVTHVWHSPRKSIQSDSGDVNVVKGLDWKRTFGLALWYGEGSEGARGYEGALRQYERIIGQDGVALPLPWYIEDPALATSSSLSTAATSSSTNPSIADEADALLELLRLATAATPLERAIYPRAFSPNRLDYRMPWHLYILLSRAMRLKDFSDRQSSFDDLDLDIEGHSEMADNVTCAYGAQLEALGQVQEAAFVLLHLEGSDGWVIWSSMIVDSNLTNHVYRRKKAIKELLMRQAHILESWQILGLTSLHIPMEWVEEAQVSIVHLFL
jgi:nuclear pore complex protein Nup98-Nup96